MVQLNFNAANVAPSQGFQTYPSGTYDVMVNNSELKPTKAKIAGTAQKGSYLQLSLRIASGEFAGGTLIARINFENDNPVAEEIGQAELSAICRVVGVLNLQDSQQLHGIPFKVVVAKVERNDKPGEYGNEIKSYLDINGNGPDQAGQGTPQQQQPPAQEAAPQPPAQTAPQPPAQQTQPPAQPPAQEAPATGAAPWQQEQQPAQQPPAQQPPAQTQPPAAGAAAPPWAQQG